MDTIEDKLNRLAQTKSDIRRALLKTGIDVPADAKFSDYITKILEAPCYKFPDLPGDVTRWSFKGLTNEQMSKNPSLEDADGKGRFLTFKNFAWSGMSGCGGYMTSKETFSYTPDIYSLNFTDPYGELKIYDVYFQLIGLDENSGVSFNLDVRESGTAKRIKRETYTKNGIYHFEYKSEDDTARLYMIGYNGVGADRTTFTVKILPYYAGALVFDGVDDYGACENFPILTKEKGYTVVALRKWLTPENKANNEILIANLKGEAWNAPNLGAFGCEIKYNNSDPKGVKAASFGQESKININENDLLFYQTSNSYNGVNLASGIGNGLGGSFLIVGSGGKTSLRANAAIWELIILDHDATEEELTKIKNYFVKTYPWLFFDQAWTVVGKSNEDTDRATITNITGNGNNLTLKNFAFSRGSGYGSWPAISFTSGLSANQPYGTLYFGGSTYAWTATGYVSNIKFKFRLRELPDDGVFVIRGYSKDSPSSDPVVEKTYDTNGVYDFSYNDNTKPVSLVFYSGATGSSMNKFYIDIIPDYEGYLVTDGVDDTIASPAFELSRDFTVVGDWKFINKNMVNAGICKHNSFAIYSHKDGLRSWVNRYNNPKIIYDFINSAGIIDTINALLSNGRIYYNDWKNEELDNGTRTDDKSYDALYAGYDPRTTVYAQMALKNLAIYSKNLSKKDCIKAYIYLQTLKNK